VADSLRKVHFYNPMQKENTVRGLLSFIYGVAAYVACLAVLLYFVAFSGNLWVPKSVDVGANAGWFEALVTDVLLLALFGVQHSVMARRGFKRWWTRIVPPPVERSTYVVATCVALALLFWLWLPITTPVIWQAQRAPAIMVLWAGFGLGAVVVVLSTFLLNHFELFGLQQVFARLTHRNMPPAAFRTPMLYRYVRHPLYVGLLLGLWSVPVMTAGRLLFAAGLSLYILIGIMFEERDLLRQFGEQYRTYQQRVGMLIPRRKLR
jgi:methanethiol S-methyltransferase